MLSCKVGSWPYPRDKAGKACQGQTLKLIVKIRKLRTKKVLKHWALRPEFKTLRTCNLRKMAIFHGNLFSCQLQTQAWTNTLAYYRIRVIEISNIL